VENIAWGYDSNLAQNPMFLPAQVQAMNELIDEAFNHPSVILYGFLNECTYSFTFPSCTNVIVLLTRKFFDLVYKLFQANKILIFHIIGPSDNERWTIIYSTLIDTIKQRKTGGLVRIRNTVDIIATNNIMLFAYRLLMRRIEGKMISIWDWSTLHP
jgi:hypothetical protein